MVEWNAGSNGVLGACTYCVQSTSYNNVIKVIGLWCCIIGYWDVVKGEMGLGDWSPLLPRARANSWYLELLHPLGSTAK